MVLVFRPMNRWLLSADRIPILTDPYRKTPSSSFREMAEETEIASIYYPIKLSTRNAMIFWPNFRHLGSITQVRGISAKLVGTKCLSGYIKTRENQLHSAKIGDGRRLTQTALIRTIAPPSASSEPSSHERDSSYDVFSTRKTLV